MIFTKLSPENDGVLRSSLLSRFWEGRPNLLRTFFVLTDQENLRGDGEVVFRITRVDVNNTTRDRFIVIDGRDGIGKTTFSTDLASLTLRDYIHFPRIHGCIHDGEKCTAREHVRDMWKFITRDLPKECKTYHIMNPRYIIDRWVTSTLYYQSVDQINDALIPFIKTLLRYVDLFFLEEQFFNKIVKRHPWVKNYLDGKVVLFHSTLSPETQNLKSH